MLRKINNAIKNLNIEVQRERTIANKHKNGTPKVLGA